MYIIHFNITKTWHARKFQIDLSKANMNKYAYIKVKRHGCFDGLFMLNMRNRLKYVHLSGIIINMVNFAINMENIIFH